jgi:hypothetical protein
MFPIPRDGRAIVMPTSLGAGSIQVIPSPKSALGDVIGYAQNQEESLRLFLEQDERPMNTNLSITAFAKADHLDTSCE